MLLYIIRHGETDWNRYKRIQGRTDIPLNESGRELARRVGMALRNVPFARVISSPLQRAVETARLAVGERSLPIRTDWRISEISFGAGEGRAFLGKAYGGETQQLREMIRRNGYQEADPQFHWFFDAPENYRPPAGGERIEELLARTRDFLDDLAKEDGDETILVSTHGAASRALLANIGQIELKDFWQGCVPPNCSVSIAARESGAWKLLERDVLLV